MANNKRFNGYSVTAEKIAFLNKQLNKANNKNLSLNNITNQSNYAEKLNLTTSTEAIIPTQTPSFLWDSIVMAVGDETITVDSTANFYSPSTIFYFEDLLVTSLGNNLYSITNEANILFVGEIPLSKVSNNTYLCNQNIPTGTYEVTFRTIATSFTGNEIITVDNIPTSKIGSTIYATTNILI